MSVAESNPESWAVGFLDECWWSRVALPALNSFSEQSKPLASSSGRSPKTTRSLRPSPATGSTCQDSTIPG